MLKLGPWSVLRIPSSPSAFIYILCLASPPAISPSGASPACTDHTAPFAIVRMWGSAFVFPSFANEEAKLYWSWLLTWGQNLKIEGGWDSEQQGLLKEVSLESKGEQRPLSCFSTARPSSLRDLALRVWKRLFGGCSPHQNRCVWATHVLILFSYSMT